MKQPLAPFLERLELGEAITYETLTLFPLILQTPPDWSYLLLEEALLTNDFSVNEIDEEGRVSLLRANNHTDTPVLILDGEEFEGAKQNRIANASFLIPPGHQSDIPVSCIERGRWAYKGRRFRAGQTIFAAGARRRKYDQVSTNLRMTQSFTSDQGQIWKDVQSYISKSQTHSETQNYSDYIRTREHKLNAYLDAIPQQPGQVGQIVFLRGQFLALDVLDDGEKAKQLYGKLLRSYSQEAIDLLEPLPACQQTSLEVGGAGILAALREIEAEVHHSVGWGNDLRFKSQWLMGSALVCSARVLHMEAFPVLAC